MSGQDIVHLCGCLTAYQPVHAVLPGEACCWGSRMDDWRTGTPRVAAGPQGFSRCACAFHCLSPATWPHCTLWPAVKQQWARFLILFCMSDEPDGYDADFSESLPFPEKGPRLSRRVQLLPTGKNNKLKAGGERRGSRSGALSHYGLRRGWGSPQGSRSHIVPAPQSRGHIVGTTGDIALRSGGPVGR